MSEIKYEIITPPPSGTPQKNPTDEIIRQFARISMAGGLQTNLQARGIVLSTAAIRGAGVLRH